jgi:succinate-semialdehyde dehydrogenase/glutarate-semialdehyde dehydrogenase
MLCAPAPRFTPAARIGNQGFFFAPTVLSDTPLSAEIMNEEPFGPVALINRYAGEEAMIAEANRLPYGLAAYAGPATPSGRRRSSRLETGMLALNTTTIGGRMRHSAA